MLEIMNIRKHSNIDLNLENYAKKIYSYLWIRPKIKQLIRIDLELKHVNRVALY